MALQEAIYNNHGSPMEYVEYQYMRLFGLSYRQVAEEPIDKLYTNLRIHAYVKDKERAENETRS